MDYCFPGVPVEEIAERLPELFGLSPQQVSPRVLLKCRTIGTALKSLPQNGSEASGYSRFSAAVSIMDDTVDESEFRSGILADLRKLIM
jgi:hypothetical protein